MDFQYFDQLTYTEKELLEDHLPPGEYADCHFIHCDLSKSSLQDFRFLDCLFRDCNLSLTTVINTSFQNVRFERCKLMGIDFSQANPFNFSIRAAHSNLTNTQFSNADLRNSSFVECDLREAIFSTCKMDAINMSGSNFERTQFDRNSLTGTDFRTAVNYSINPNQNTITGAKFSLAQIVGLLDQYELIIES